MQDYSNDTQFMFSSPVDGFEETVDLRSYSYIHKKKHVKWLLFFAQFQWNENFLVGIETMELVLNMGRFEVGKEVKYLGLTMDHTLKFETQVNENRSRAMWRLRALYQNCT